MTKSRKIVALVALATLILSIVMQGVIIFTPIANLWELIPAVFAVASIATLYGVSGMRKTAIGSIITILMGVVALHFVWSWVILIPTFVIIAASIVIVVTSKLRWYNKLWVVPVVAVAIYLLIAFDIFMPVLVVAMTCDLMWRYRFKKLVIAITAATLTLICLLTGFSFRFGWIGLLIAFAICLAIAAVVVAIWLARVKHARWSVIIAMLISVVLLITTIVIAVLFAWWALLPAIALCAVAIWLVALFNTSLIWIPILALVMSTLLFGVFGINGFGNKQITVNQNVQNQTVQNQTVQNQTVQNDQNVQGDVNIGGDQNVEGDVNVGGDQNVEGDVNVGGDQNVEGDVNVGGDQNVEGDVNIGGDQNVEGDVNVGGDVNVEGDVNVGGDVNVEGDVNVGGDVNTDEEPSDKPEIPDEPAHTHSYVAKVTKEATCTEDGVKTYTCECGDSYTEAIPKLGHKYTSKVVEPTTEAQGYTLHTCERCGDSYKDNYTDKLVPEKVPAIKCSNTIRYGETVYVTLEDIDAANVVVSNKRFVSVEVVSNTRIAVTLTEDVDGYLTITDTVSKVNVVIDIVVE